MNLSIASSDNCFKKFAVTYDMVQRNGSIGKKYEREPELPSFIDQYK